jgi:hypothetical protein
MTRHFVVQLENRPGELAHLARALAARGIDIRQIAGGGEGRFGFAFLSTDDEEATANVLTGMGVPFISGETVVADVEDRPGALADVTEKLAAAGINVVGVMIIGRGAGRVEIGLSVDDAVRAREVLGAETVVAS